MKTLLVDTSFGFKAAYEDTEKEILELISVDTTKLSEVFHTEIDQLILKYNSSWKNLDNYIYNLGPGSYTGLKIGSSLASSLKTTSTKTFGYHEYKLPYLLGYSEGIWIDKAFKKQIFVYEWNKEKSHHYLLDINDFFFKPNQRYFCKNDLVWDKVEILSTQDLFKNEGSKIIKRVLDESNENQDQDIFYYRTIDMEYNRS